MKKLFIAFLFLLLTTKLYSAPDTAMSILPVAVDGATIEADDENSRNNVVSSTYNAHDHTDISKTANTLNVGDGAAGAKTITAYNADSNKPYIRYNDTLNNWIISTDGLSTSLIFSPTEITFEGATNDTKRTTLRVTDPTDNRTILFPDQSGQVPLGTAGYNLTLTTTGTTNVTLPTTGTVWSNTTGIALPSGAVFFMLTGSCPAGTTDVTATYANKFLRINATQGATGGADTATLSTANLANHTHVAGTLVTDNESAHTHQVGNTIHPANDGAGIQYTAGNTVTATSGAGSPHNHTVSGSTGGEGSGTAFNITNAYVTAKLCQCN